VGRKALLNPEANWFIVLVIMEMIQLLLCSLISMSSVSRTELSTSIKAFFFLELHYIALFSKTGLKCFNV